MSDEEYVDNLLKTSDALVRKGGLCPFSHAEGVLESWERASRVHFDQLARLALVSALRPPEGHHVVLFIERLRARTRHRGR